MSSAILNRSRIVVYKLCKAHSRSRCEPQELERICADCRRSIFRASMKARGITISTPTYPGVRGTPNGYTANYGSASKLFARTRPEGVFSNPERIPGWRDRAEARIRELGVRS